MKVVSLNQVDFVKQCNELADLIDSRPDLIVGVLNGGGFILKEFREHSKFCLSQFQSVKYQRRGGLKHNIFVKFVIRCLPYKVLNIIRVLESNKAKNSIHLIDEEQISKIKIIMDEISFSKEIKNILIIDDAIDTGKTMFVVKNNLSKLFSHANIETAVISWTINSSIVKPDYYLYQNILVRFPWSKDYKGVDFEKKGFSS